MNERITIAMFEESSHRVMQQYKMLCAIKDDKGKSVCETGEENILSRVINNALVDEPSKGKYNFDYNHPNVQGQLGIPQMVDEILGSKRNGFFIECGALDGEEISNTLYH